MAEWLGKGLQNLLQRFDSASHLKKVLYNMLWGTFRFFTPGFTPEIHFQSPIYTKNLTTTKIINYRHKHNSYALFLLINFSISLLRNQISLPRCE